MPFNRDARETLLGRIAGDFNTNLPGVDAMLRRSVVGVISFAHGIVMDGIYGFLGWIARQIHPTTADEEALLRSASFWLPVPRRDATFAAGIVAISGVDGAVLPAGAQWRRADGAVFEVAADAVLDGTAGTAEVSALAAGAGGNCAAGTAMTLLSPVSGIASSAVVGGGGVVGGADVESLASVLARILRRVQTPPQGGSGDDYISWIFDAHPAVTRAWVYPRELGAGTVTLRFACDSLYAGGIPLSGDVAIVAASVAARQPVGGEIYAFAPLPLAVDFTVDGLSPDTEALRTAIAASLADLIRREGTPGGQYWGGYSFITGGLLLRSHLIEAINSVAGVDDFTLTAPAANVAVGTGYLPTMGVIAWT
jgi:uncharacterized phage protein gp47/JayE